MRLLPLVVVAALAACSNAAPCTTCPPLAGSYAVSWRRGTQAQAGCPAVGPQPQTLTFTQAGSTATVLVDGLMLSGSVYDTFDFALSATREDVSYALRGAVGTTGAASDAGVRITGSLITRSDACELRENYTGDKISP